MVAATVGKRRRNKAKFWSETQTQSYTAIIHANI